MKNRLDVAVSYYEHIYTKFPVRATLIDLLTTNRYKSRVLAVRTESDARKKKELKTRLPAFTPSGLFRGGAANTLLKPTGLVCIDIDRKDNLQVEGYDRLKDKLGRLPYVAFCGRSVGGEGYYAIVPIAQPNKLLLHFRSLQTEFSAMGITIDPSCCDISRKRFVSYDPEPYINQEAEIYEGLADGAAVPDITGNATLFGTDSEDEPLKEVLKYIQIIEQKKVDITAGYANWLRIGYALHNAFGDFGRELFHRVSSFHPRYSYVETDRLFSGLSKGNCANQVTIRSFFYFVRQHGLDAAADFGVSDEKG